MEFTWDSRSALVQEPQEHQDRTNNSARRGPPRVSTDNCVDIFSFLDNYGVLVCRQHRTGIVNLEKHLQQQHAVSLQQRQQIVQHFSELTLVSPDAVELPE
jgi:hypothetical protein